MRRFITIFILVCFNSLLTAQVKETAVVVDASHLQYKINRNIYGQFSEHLGHCIYGGIWVGDTSSIPNIDGIRKDIVDALREIKVPVLRWPGGCFADEYHWMDGVGPRNLRPKMINTNWGGVTEDNSFGTHEFLEFCKLVGCEPYFTGNVGSGSVRELSQWVEYVNSDNVSPMTELRAKNGRDKSCGVKYWGIGNEAWGCGGNMTPEYYSNLVRRISTFMHDYGKNKIFKIACGPSDDDYNWTDVVMKNAGGYIDGLSFHHYSFANSKIATDFDERGWFDIMKKSLSIDEMIKKHSAIMDIYDPGKRVALDVDEWGTWYKVEPGTNPAFLFQQNTLRDAVAAASTLNILNNHSDRVRMANIAQMVNVLQSMLLTNGDKMVRTPTYYVFDMYKVHQDAMWIPTDVKSTEYTLDGQKLPAVNCSASLDKDGKMHISLCNINPDAEEHVEVNLSKFTADRITGQILTAGKMNVDNTFDNPSALVPENFSRFKINGSRVEVSLPPMSVVVLELTGTLAVEPPIQLKNPLPGLNYKYYEGTWTILPNFSRLSPRKEGVTNDFTLIPNTRDENFGIQYDGYIKIPSDGMYTFYLNSDDGSALYIDNMTIVTNDGRHAPKEESGSDVLRAGYHKITVTFFQASGGMELAASIEGPGLQKSAIPSDMLFREGK
ncbi:MAG TPA: alpha-L-arabinofuranosidase C-terminal domain-containing protein [Candidatus Kryptonia bacterium]